MSSVALAKEEAGSYRFTGDYLGDLEPTGTQYLFDGRFTASTNGEVLWNGGMGWAGGHVWTLTLSNIVLLPRAHLMITPHAGSVRMEWPTNFAGHTLEFTRSLSAIAWEPATNAVTFREAFLGATADASEHQRFFRLRTP